MTIRREPDSKPIPAAFSTSRKNPYRSSFARDLPTTENLVFGAAQYDESRSRDSGSFTPQLIGGGFAAATPRNRLTLA